jgi:hypothetical protein
VPSLVISLFLVLVLFRPAHAYLDGGTGSMILQTLLAGVGGIVVFLRLRWNRLFKKKTQDQDPKP